ncbi:MAG: dockerin type I domain-containing protein [Phycisphaerae bacterium]
MRGYLNCRTLAACLGVGLLACGAANAQYAADFEPPTFTGSADGVDIWGQDAFYNPAPAGSETITAYVYTYANNVLGIPDNPAGGGEQFVAGTGPGGGTYSRAERGVDWGTGIVVATYDVLCAYEGDPNSTANNLGSFSAGWPPPVNDWTFIHLFSWVSPGAGDTWQALYMVHNAQGGDDGAPGRVPGPQWVDLDLYTWYRCTTVIDWDINQVVEVSITNLDTGAGATVDTSAEGWYLEGGEAGGEVTATFRFFAGGGLPGNTVAWDNLSIGPAAEPCPGDVDGDGDTDLSDLAALLAAYGSSVGDPNYNPAADFEPDGDVDLTDLAFLLSAYGCAP